MSQAPIMRCITSILLCTALTLLSSASTSSDSTTTIIAIPAAIVSELNINELEKVLHEGKTSLFLLGKTKRGKDIEAYFFPGTGNKRALIIGGVHGSELSSIEVAIELVD